MTKKYFPDPDDSDIIFNLPADASVNDGEKSTEDFELNMEEDSDESPEDVSLSASKSAAVEEDSDEAPEDVSFAASKSEAISLRKAEAKSQRDAQEKRKQKQLKNEARMKEQKEEKAKRLQSLASKRLPEDILEAISAVSEPKKKKKVVKEKPRPKPSHTKFEDDHYIPLSTESSNSKFEVAVLESKKWKNTFSKPGQCPVKDFRHNALYNSKIKRESTQAVQQARLKQQATRFGEFCGSST